jgi:hypothetical protein
MTEISSLKRRAQIQPAAPERPTQCSPRDRGASRSHTSHLFNCIVEGRVCGGHPYVQEAWKTQYRSESANNEEQFASQFFDFMRKHPKLIISQVSVPQINLELDTATPHVVTAPSSASSSPENQKYPVGDINECTPCTLLYVKGRMLRTIKVDDAIVLATRIMHGWPVPLDCAVVEGTTIKEVHEFEDLDYPDEEEGIEKLKDAKGNFILCPCKDIFIKTRSSPIVSPQSREDDGTPTSQNIIHSTTIFTPPYQNPPKTTSPPENPPYTQPVKHHFLKPPHTTHPLQNLPTE